jgi:hypothetical protein
MAAIFPIPYDIGPGEPVPTRGNVIAFEPRRGNRRRANRRRNDGFLLAATAAVVAILLALGAVFAVIDAWSQPPATAPVAVPAEMATGAGSDDIVVVQSGDTLTSIARDLQPTGDISALVDELAARHGPAPLQPGERLTVGDSVRGVGRGG